MLYTPAAAGTAAGEPCGPPYYPSGGSVAAPHRTGPATTCRALRSYCASRLVAFTYPAGPCLERWHGLKNGLKNDRGSNTVVKHTHLAVWDPGLWEWCQPSGPDVHLELVCSRHIHFDARSSACKLQRMFTKVMKIETTKGRRTNSFKNQHAY